MNTRIVIIFILALYYFSGCWPQETPTEPIPQPESLMMVTAGYSPAVSKDGKKLAYSRNGAIFISDTNGKSAIQLTSGAFNDIYPRWSSDGQRIAFIRKDNSQYGYGNVMVVDTLNKNSIPVCTSDAVYYKYLERAQTNFSNLILDWSPSNDKIAFYSGSDTMTHLVIVKSDGSGSVLGKYTLNVSTSDNVWGNRSGYYWAPNGSQIVCTSNFYSDTSFLYTITVGIDTMIKVSSHWGACFPAWSPDGNILSYKAGYGDFILHDLRTNFQNKLRASYSPKLSPNGKKIVYYSYYHNSNPDGYSTSEYRVIDVSTGISTFLVRTGWDYYYVWHPSSKYIFYEEAGVIYRVDVPE